MVGMGSLWGVLGGIDVQAQGGSAAESLHVDEDTTVYRMPDGAGSRAEQWKQKRRAKPKQMHPSEPGFFDRAGRFFSRISGSMTPRRLILTVPPFSCTAITMHSARSEGGSRSLWICLIFIGASSPGQARQLRPSVFCRTIPSGRIRIDWTCRSRRRGRERGRDRAACVPRSHS